MNTRAALAKWKVRVNIESTKIYRRQSKTRANEIRNAWSKNWNDQTSLLRQRHRPYLKLCMLLNSKRSSQMRKLPLHFLQPVTPLPAMKAWTQVQKNVLATDEPAFYNIPYINDDFIEKNGTFIAKMREEYAVKSDAGGLDSILVELVDVLMQKYGQQENDFQFRWNPKMVKNDTFPLPIIFDAISSNYATQGTAEEFWQKYLKLSGRLDSTHRCAPNIDGDMTEIQPRERTLRSFVTYFCRRCFKYNCLEHGSKASLIASNPKTQRIPKMKYNSEPCGSYCFKTHGHIKVDADDNIEWTGADHSLLRVIYPIYSENYCAMAEVLRTKTCLQVYQLIRSEAFTLDTLETKPRIRATRKKRIKPLTQNKRSILSIHCRKTQSETELVHNYTPCKHSGPCNNNCNCVQSLNFCEKFCECSKDCRNRFPGCRCTGTCSTTRCPCNLGKRECDPDLCRSCGGKNFARSELNCKNSGIQRGFVKPLLLAPSTVAGWGIFLNGAAKKDDLISEYCGEIITQKEAERRGEIYDKQKCSYLFNLNNEFVIDATRLGNKIRFANHSINPNCYAKIMMVNGDHRIGIYAKHDISAGEELLFDYRYKPNQQLKFVPIECKIETV